MADTNTPAPSPAQPVSPLPTPPQTAAALSPVATPLAVSNYAVPYSTTPLPSAQTALSFLVLDLASGTGRIELDVYQDAASAAAGLSPVGRIVQGFVVADQLQADPAFAAALQAVATSLVGLAQSTVPVLSKATAANVQVPA